MSRISLFTSYLLLVAVSLQFVSGTQAHVVFISHNDNDDDDKDLTPDELKRRRIGRIVAASVVGAGCLLALIAYFIYARRKKKIRARAVATMGPDSYPFAAAPDAYTAPPSGVQGYGPPPATYMPGKENNLYGPNPPFGYQSGPPPSQYPPPSHYV
ncbi:hypothetical protein B0H13DRAFT_2358869 [Mycena leptocephala]|nr:hypothetical protein B0H13DRAFT_2358869 [Mycena leptocephala]